LSLEQRRKKAVFWKSSERLNQKLCNRPDLASNRVAIEAIQLGRTAYDGKIIGKDGFVRQVWTVAYSVGMVSNEPISPVAA
jgi:hypothetical protein